MLRRQFLRAAAAGSAGVTVGLPWLPEMAGAAGQAADAVVPTRAFNLFFGLGIPTPLQSEGYDGVLEPLRPLADKLLLLQNVDQVRCNRDGINAHYDGASGAFTATPPDGEARAGGASIDQLIRLESKGQADIPTLIAGTYFRRSRVGRYVHSYNPDGTVAATIQETPRQLFDRVFGRIGDSDTESARRRRIRRSVLDAVVDQYKQAAGSRSPLSADSRQRIGQHLERVREYERRVFAPQHGEGPDAIRSLSPPPESELAHGGSADPGGEGIDITIDQLTTEWHLMADLYALAIETDRTRFGSLTFLAAGERLRVRGDYHHNDRLVYQFDDAAQLNASGSAGCSHEWWHKFSEKKENTQLRAHVHFKMSQLAHFLMRLDAVVEPNGRSILENSLISISTESGDGRHSDPKRELSGVFHAVTSAAGRLKTGRSVDTDAEGLDVYNTILASHGATSRLGPADREARLVESILA